MYIKQIREQYIAKICAFVWNTFQKSCLIFCSSIQNMCSYKQKSNTKRLKSENSSLIEYTFVRKKRLFNSAALDPLALHLNCYLFISSYKALRHLIICFKGLNTAGARAWRRIPGNDTKATLNVFTVLTGPKEFAAKKLPC